MSYLKSLQKEFKSIHTYSYWSGETCDVHCGVVSDKFAYGGLMFPFDKAGSSHLLNKTYFWILSCES